MAKRPDEKIPAELPCAQSNVRAVFYLDGDVVVSVDIGTHAIYRS